MNMITGARRLGLSVLGLLLLSVGQLAMAAEMLGVACETPPPMHCADGDCAGRTAAPGNVREPESGRQYFLGYPCDLQPGEDVMFVLNIHGAGSSANWQRHYFPAMDYKEAYRLVVATPTAEGSAFMGSGNGVRVWAPQTDGAYLQAITRQVTEAFVAENIKSFWLAGHSQGGMTSRRLVCSESLPDDSPWAERYQCEARKRSQVVDSRPGRVYDTGRAGYPVWGREAAPGTADVYEFPACEGNRVVADVVRLDKGHTEGLEPEVTQRILELMASAKGGKLQAGAR